MLKFDDVEVENEEDYEYWPSEDQDDIEEIERGFAVDVEESRSIIEGSTMQEEAQNLPSEIESSNHVVEDQVKVIEREMPKSSDHKSVRRSR